MLSGAASVPSLIVSTGGWLAVMNDCPSDRKSSILMSAK